MLIASLISSGVRGQTAGTKVPPRASREVPADARPRNSALRADACSSFRNYEAFVR